MKQASVEQMMHELGVERQQALSRRAREEGRFSTTTAGKYMLKRSVGALAEEIRRFLKLHVGKAGRNHTAIPYLHMFPADMELVALITCKCVIDGLVTRTNLPGLAARVAGRLQDELMFREMAQSDAGLWKFQRRTLARQGYGHFKRSIREQLDKNKIEWTQWPYRDRYRVGLCLVELLHQATSLIEIVSVKVGRRRKTVVRPTQETLSWVEQAEERHETLFPFNLPCTIPPAPWTNLYDGGYHTRLVTKYPMVKVKGALTSSLMSLEDLEMPEVYSAVNTLQNTAWELNEDVYEVVRHFWDSGNEVADLPLREDLPIPTRPDRGAPADIKKDWRRKAARVHERNNENRSKRLLIAKTFFMAERYKGLRFWYPYHLDFRGRFYPTPYFLQPQGHGQARGLLRFAEGKPIENKEQADWLAIHGANVWGEDKGTFEQRLAFIENFEVDICAVYEDPVSNSVWTQADKPWEFLAFCLEWGAFKEQGYGFVSKIPVAVDGSNNGLQIFSLLLRDAVGATATNVAPTATPSDVYQDVADATMRLLKTKYKDDPRAEQWLAFMGDRAPRKMTKRLTMCVPYGLKNYSAQEYVAEWYRSHLKSNGNMTPFQGEAYKEIYWLTQVIWEALDETVGAARACMGWLQDVARLVADENMGLSWSTPSGFWVNQKYFKVETQVIQTIIGESVRNTWIATAGDGDQVHKMRQVNGIAPNFVHSLDAAAACLTVNRCREAGIVSF